MTLREALDLAWTSGVAKGDATLWGRSALATVPCCAWQLIRHSAMGAGPRGCYLRSFWGSARRRHPVATLHRVFKDLDWRPLRQKSATGWQIAG